ncbi:MAG: response regulator [Elusimicrobiota bacterium]
MDKKRIFVLDDEPDMTMLVEHMLSYKGFEVTTSNNPAQAVEQLNSEDYATIVIDLMMPGLDGFGVISKLRGNPRHQTTPIIVLSAKRLSDTERKSILTSKVRFIPKPISPSRLVQVVRESAGN